MRNKVVTVFGGSGFIGRHLVRRLAEREATIRVATRSPEKAIFLKPMGAVGQIVMIRCDTADPQSVERVVAGADYVVNLVGILHERKAGDFNRMHAELPGLAGKAASANGCTRFVQVSAIGADAGSASAYARSKGAGEEAARGTFSNATILRPSIVFGPEDSFFNRFAAMARFAPALPLIGGGRTRFQPVYVGDVADAIVAALERNDAPKRTYELGGPRVYTFRELLTYMLEVLNRRRLLVDVPFGLAALQGRFFELLPEPPLTRDQVEMLKRDNVVSPDAKGLEDLGISPTPLEVIVPQYLAPYGRPRIRIPTA
jgi:NADH dehydrogenase